MGEPLAPVEAGSGVQRPARKGRSTCRGIDDDDLGRGCRWPQHDPPLELATEAFILFEGCVPHRRPLLLNLKCFCPARFHSKTNDSCRRLWKLKSPNTLYGSGAHRSIPLSLDEGHSLEAGPNLHLS